jgi:hypothetical protein
MNQQAALAAVDAVLSTSRPEAVPPPKARQTVADAGTMHHGQQENRAEAAARGSSWNYGLALATIPADACRCLTSATAVPLRAESYMMRPNREKSWIKSA